MRISDLYEQDIHAWTQQTAQLLRQHRFQDLDIEHLVEELETMSRRDRQELVSRLKILLGHLLKWQHQPAHRSSAWHRRRPRADPPLAQRPRRAPGDV